MSRRSAGIAMYRRSSAGIEVLLVHPGGPLWARRDKGVWGIPKGEYEEGEDAQAAARREFAEEIGSPPPAGDLIDLGEIKQRSGKLVRAWGVEGDLDAGAIVSNTFSMEWPPRSGRLQRFPEVDRAEWFTLAQAREQIIPGQVPLLERLERALA